MPVSLHNLLKIGQIKAHPTEAARRTVLAKLRELARLLDELEAAGDDEAASARTMARLEELIDLLWQTDEIRVARPEVLDEARQLHPRRVVARESARGRGDAA